MTFRPSPPPPRRPDPPPPPEEVAHAQVVSHCLDVDAGRVVKGVNFVGLRDDGDPASGSRRRRGRRRAGVPDITASSEPRHHGRVDRLVERRGIPFKSAVGCARSTTPRLLMAGARGAANRALERPAWWRVPPSSGPSAWSSPSTPVDARTGASRSTRTGAARPPGSTPSSGPGGRRTSAPGRSCSRRWTATAPRRGSTSSSPERSPTRWACPSSPAAVSAPWPTWWAGSSTGARTRSSLRRSSTGEHTVAEAKDEMERAGVIVRPVG